MKLHALILVAISSTCAAQQTVNGHVRKDGTYVAPYVRSTPNATTIDNYSTRGNVNPYTGQSGSAPQNNIYVPPAPQTPMPNNIYRPPGRQDQR